MSDNRRFDDIPNDIADSEDHPEFGEWSDLFRADTAYGCLYGTDWEDGDWHEAIAYAVEMVMGSDDMAETLAMLFIRLVPDLAVEDGCKLNVPADWIEWATWRHEKDHPS
jgi:hypothetical protein